MLSPAHDVFVVNIPKNASSFVHDWCSEAGWRAVEIDNTERWRSITKVIVVLRDPVERWISGFAQYCCSWILNASRFFDISTGPDQYWQRQTARNFVESYSWLTERLIFDNAESFDDHVWPQNYFFESLLPAVPRCFFLLDHTFESRFQQHLSLPAPRHDLDRNRSDNDPDMKIIKAFMRRRLQTIKGLRDTIDQAYARDHAIIRQFCQ